MIVKNKQKINKKNQELLKKKLNNENIKIYRVDFDRVDFARGWILIAGGF